MAEKSSIEWTEATWNPVVGCDIVSPGCTNCYAMGMAARIETMAEGAGQQTHYVGTTRKVKGRAVWTGDLALAPEHILMQPLRWTKPRVIFVNSMGDLFHPAVPDWLIDHVFAVMALTPQHTYQILTKRGDRMRAYLNAKPQEQVSGAVFELAQGPDVTAFKAARVSDASVDLWPLPNVWLGVSAERQQEADERIPDLLATPAAVRFVSAEPLLGPIDFTELQDGFPPNAWLTWLDGLDWIIVGGESGPNARPVHPDWVRSIRDQSAAADVPFFFKQWGSHRIIYDRDKDDPDWRRCDFVRRDNPAGRWLNLEGGHGFHGERVIYAVPASKKAAGRLLDGHEHNGMPQPREVPAL